MADSPATTATFSEPRPFAVEAQGLALEFFPRGRDRLEALLALIGSARLTLKVAFYIFATDESATRVREALTAAARRGVEVRLIVDGFGALADERFFAPLIEAGGSFSAFIPGWTRNYLIRNHQKIVVVDDRVVMLGGFNVENSYFEPVGREGWSDLAFTVEGTVVRRFGEWFDSLKAWVTRRDAKLRSIQRMVRDWDCGEGPVQILIGGPTYGLSGWANEVGSDLVEGDRLDLTMAYFSPPPRLLNRICRIARKGRTRLLFPQRSDNGVTIRAARAQYAKLLRNGARIWEFRPGKLHTKLIVLDDAVYLGSANFDMRSLFLNLEIVLKIEDAGLASRLREYFAYHLPVSQEITPQLHAARATWLNRLRWRLAWFLVVVVDYTVSRRLNFGAEGFDQSYPPAS